MAVMPTALPTTLDAPFLAPLECVVDLPFPPSANKLWTAAGGGQLTRSRQYMAWKDQAGLEAVANGSWRRRIVMPARFTVAILLDSAHRRLDDGRRKRDGDNCIKPVLDWAQSVELVSDDSLCDGGEWRWVTTAEAPAGCRLILRSIA
jgi:Holliday junction resolvase RusA-like endonuclease